MSVAGYWTSVAATGVLGVVATVGCVWAESRAEGYRWLWRGRVARERWNRVSGFCGGLALACFMVFLLGLVVGVELSQPVARELEPHERTHAPLGTDCATDLECYGHGGYELPSRDGGR